MNRIQTTAAIAVLSVIGMASISGCTNETEGQHTMVRAQRMEDAGIMIRQGEKNVADGRALQTRGQTIKDQGDNPEGDRLMAQGRAQEKLGQEQIDQGRQLRDKAD
ncbi:MAG TPA: hypothetical protein VHD56_08260 [Tepidisphaeraceae bacterium]|nr:hypothetical protein [Tepidisphaeraceae bacterium]